MANTRELRRRIRSVKNTSQITKAMQMVAATKMRKAQTQAENGRPYSATLNESLQRLTANVNSELNPLLKENEAKNIGVILLSTDKGLVGALNTNLLRQTQNFSKEKSDLIFYTLGRKGRQFIAKTNKALEADFENPEAVTFRQATQLANLVIKSFLDNQIKEAYIIYPSFISTLRQEPKVVKLLPISPADLPASPSLSSSNSIGGSRTKDSLGHENDSNQEFLFEPNTSELLDFVLKHSVEVKIYQALLETKASEHSARMISMQNATDNAKELVADLTLTYNQTRQDAITRELLEITTAQAALE